MLKKDIISWLRSQNIEKYSLVPHPTYGCVVDVAGDVDLSDRGLITIPVQFGIVRGDFFCDSNQLTNLLGCPLEVSGDFICDNNLLNSLLGAPKTVGDWFQCSNNSLTNLIGAPDFVGGSFFCDHNSLTTLEGSPNIQSTFNCSYNQLTSLVGAPSQKVKDFFCSNNLLINLIGAPAVVTSEFIAIDNRLESVTGTLQTVGREVFFLGNPKLEHCKDMRIFVDVQEGMKIIEEQRALQSLLHTDNKKVVLKI